jgi:hypothetical protein
MWQKGKVDDGQPSLTRLEALRPCTILKVPDGFSAMPFWKWVLTPQKVSGYPLALQLFM